MRLEVLISCMHQKDHSIIERTNIQSDVIVVNQCNTDKYEEWTFTNKNGEECRAIFISTTERGLSKSRNMAIQYAAGDICLICDDDEVFEDDYVDKILNTYRDNPTQSIIAFRLKGITYTSFPNNKKRITFPGILRIASQQISFKLKDITTNRIKFDTKMGSGTGNGGGEENKFLLDCHKNNLKIIYVPQDIVTINNNSVSSWFHGYSDKFFVDRGWSNKHLLGFPLGILYSIYWAITHHWIYKKESTLLNALRHLVIGTFQNR